LTNIYIAIDAGAVKDVNNNNFAGINNSTTWYFASIEQSQEPQTISFAATRTVAYGDADFEPGATTTSNLPISYSSSDETIASIVSGKIHIKKAGTVTITASQPGDEEYLAAT